MNKTNLVISIIATGLISAALGGVAGFLYAGQQVSPQLNVIKSLSTQIIPSMVAYGEVANIEGRNITLSYGGDSIKIRIEESSPIYSHINNSVGKSVQEKVSFGDIKKGDNLSIAVKLLPDGQLQSQSVFILRPVPKIK